MKQLVSLGKPGINRIIVQRGSTGYITPYWISKKGNLCWRLADVLYVKRPDGFVMMKKDGQWIPADAVTTTSAPGRQAVKPVKTKDTYPFPDRINGTDDDPLYQVERCFPGSESSLSGYRIPLPPGNYEVTLHFAECSFQEPGKRIFYVLLEGQEKLIGFEPMQAGFRTATWKSVSIEVLDGFLDIQFVSRNGKPQVAAIEVLPD